ncbi:MAG: outer membrane beta-barrel protein [Xanthobacteraceae bacterium]
MRKSLFCSAAALSVLLGLSLSARAADLPMAPPSPPPQAPCACRPFSWTGFYLGGNLGAGWNHGNISDSAGLFSWGADNSTTFVGGGQVGANYQISNIVLGIEGDFDWFANNNNSGGGTAIAGGAAGGSFVQGSNNGRWLTTVTGRAGLAADRLLFYVKGGGAWVGSNNLTLTNLPAGGSVSIGNSNTNTGWTAGAGIEWAFANNWTAKFEYDYVGLSDKSLTVTLPTAPPVADTFSTNNRNVQMVTVGVNYLFNWGY